MTPGSPPRPPRLGETLLRWLLPPGPVGRSILGDAREEFHRAARARGPAHARRRYWATSLSLAWRFGLPGFLERFSPGLSPKAFGDTMQALWFDIRNAGRLLVRRPGFTLIVVGSLALGIGANTAVFSLVNTILLSPLPYPDSQELVEVFRIDEDVTGLNPGTARVSGLWAVPFEVHLDWMEMSPVFSSGGGYAGGRVDMATEDGPISLRVGLFTSGVFSALGSSPHLGRRFLPEDDAVGAPPVVVLSHGLWRSHFGEDAEVLGRQLDLEGSSYTVVGVMGEGFGFPTPDYQAWISFPDYLKTSPVRNGGYLKVVARLSPGISVDQARRELVHVAGRIGEAHPEEAEHGIGVFPLKDLMVSDAGSGLLVSLGAVALVLLIACTNIAGLLLVRATEKRREMGVRQAMGAPRHRIAFQHLSEALLLSLLGGAAGYALAVFGMKPFLALMPSDLPRLGELRIDEGLLLAAGGFSLLTGLVTGLLPAVRATRTPITCVLQEGGRSLAGGRSGNRVQAGLVVSQIALAFILLTGAGLVTRSLMRLMSVDTGLDTETTLLASVGLPQDVAPPAEARGSAEAWEPALIHYREVERRLRSIPGIQDVGAASQMPFAGGWSAPPATWETPSGTENGVLHVAAVLPSYFPTLGIELVSGRPLTTDDGANSEPVVVISEAMASRMAPDDSPLGLRIRVDTQGDSIWRSVVGVVRDVRYRMDYGPMPMAYVPVDQRPTSITNWVLRTSSDPASLVSAVRAATSEVDPGGNSSVEVLDDSIRRSYAVTSARFSVILLGSIAGLAGLLAVLGVYGVLAYLVQLRSREIGIQLAMGAEKRRVLRTFLLRGLAMAGVGMSIGALLSLAFGKVMASQLFGIQPRDPVTYLVTGLLLVFAVTLASLIPARRAAGLDPAEVLRRE